VEIQTRRQILEIWRAAIDYSYRDGKWTWGGRRGRNSIADAEQLLTILYPATAIDSLRVDNADQIADDVLDHLRAFGNALDIPRQIVRLARDYLDTYLVDGAPDFSGDYYFHTDDDNEAAEIGTEQRKLHVVDSYSMSVTLCLAVLGFTRAYRQTLRSPRLIKEADELNELASQRLTAALVGLLRSFTVNTYDPSDPPGQVMCQMVNQTGVASDILVHNLLGELAEVRAGLRQELSIGLRQVADELENRGRMFECGWSWGVIDGAPDVSFVTNIGHQPVGVADPRPYLYFTVVALDGIQDLFNERTRLLGLLDDEQQRLARALQLRWDLTRQFWAKLATFGNGRWPLEDLPWMTSDGRESDYYSVLLTSIVLEGVGSERVANIDVERIGRLLEELANRGRITRRPMQDDPAIDLHVPGIQLRLVGSEIAADGPGLAGPEGPRLLWTVSSYSMLVLKRLFRVAELLEDSASRSRFLEIADQIWTHVERRKLDAPAARGLWDEPTRVFTDTSFAAFGTPSWYHTERVVEALVSAANVTHTVHTTTATLSEHAQDLLAEAEHLFDRERLRGTSSAGEQMRDSFQVISTKLRRARELMRERPGTASVLAAEVLRDLDMVDAARQDTSRMI
jgi:hypothetical protein